MFKTARHRSLSTETDECSVLWTVIFWDVSHVYSEDRGDAFLRYINKYLHDCATSQLIRPQSTFPLSWEAQISNSLWYILILSFHPFLGFNNFSSIHVFQLKMYVFLISSVCAKFPTCLILLDFLILITFAGGQIIKLNVKQFSPHPCFFLHL